MTCAITPQRDWLLYILYCSDVQMISDLIRTSINNIKLRFKQNTTIHYLLEQYEPRQSDTLLVLQAKFIVLLHEDEGIRKELTERKVHNVGKYGPIYLEKANRFYNELHTSILPKWACDESMTLDQFIDYVRSIYLVS